MPFKRSLTTLIACCTITTTTLAAEPLSQDNFTRIHKLILPSGDESRWLEIDWHTDFWQARKAAAATGKPILLWSGGGALPLGGC